jgi:HD-GYP domain-containing protein (c-di-GMP phosphodiesterase class II)
MRLVMLAEQLVGEARVRRAQPMPRREALIRGMSAVAFLAAAAAIAWLIPNERDTDLLVVLGLVAGYALVSRVRFEFGDLYVVPEQLVLVAMMALAPLPLVPLMVAAGSVIGVIPDFVRGEWHWDRTITTVGDCWFAVGPVLVLAAGAPGTATLDDAPWYALAYCAQVAGDFVWALIRDRLVDRLPLIEVLKYFGGVTRVDAILTPLAFLASVASAAHPFALVGLVPLVWMLSIFSRERQERYAAALELNRAYRGTVMLLSDVLEHDDEYTAEHSRSVVDLSEAVGSEMGVEGQELQELEFAAMLHDIGKIAIPKQILHKPSSLTADEFEIIKNHTIEGQFILDRVGGLLGRVGEIVRSCHERWDGTGYPDGLKGENIPLPARIVFACDAFNAMTTDRPYRKALTSAAAIEELVTNAGSQFDPDVVVALVKVVEEGPLHIPSADHVRAVLLSSQAPEGAPTHSG